MDKYFSSKSFLFHLINEVQCIYYTYYLLGDRHHSVPRMPSIEHWQFLVSETSAVKIDFASVCEP